MTTTPPPTTCAALYRDVPAATSFAGPPAFAGILQEIFARWSTDANDMLSEDELFDEVLCNLGADEACGGILIFVATPAHPQGVVQVLHSVRECWGPGTHRRVVFVCVGNVQEFDIDVAQFSKDLPQTTTPEPIQKNAKARRWAPSLPANPR